MLKKDMTEIDELLAGWDITDEKRIEWIKENALNRFNVKKSHRPHIKRILDDAFAQLREYGKES